MAVFSEKPYLTWWVIILLYIIETLFDLVGYNFIIYYRNPI